MFNLIVGVILIDMPIFDVPLGVIVEKQQIITSPMVDVKNEILHVLNQDLDQNQNQRQSHLAISIVSVILIDMLIFDVLLGVIVQRQPAIGINTEEEKNEILHALDQSRSHAQENAQSHAQAQAQDQRFAHKSR